MAGQEKSFKELQNDERLKRLERQLKLNQVKRPNSLQPSSSAHMSISGISSIHGDNAFSDVSFCSSQASSSRAGSVILASSLNLRKNIPMNLKNCPNAYSPTTSSVFEQSIRKQKVDQDRLMMPPPPPSSHDGHESQMSHKTERIGRAVDSMSKQSCLVNYESEAHSVNETYGSDHNVTVERESSKEPSRSLDIATQQGRTWKNWIIRLNKDGQIIIKGKLESGDAARSKAIKKRVTATVVVSVFNHVYRLLGDMHDVREELPEYIRGKFYNGFPTDWENVRQVWQSYVLSGYSLSFRWPTPVADSDDDLRSDITDLTVSRSKNPKITSVYILSPPLPHLRQGTRETDKNVAPGESQTSQKVPSDITLSGPKETELKTSCENSEIPVPAPNNHSNLSYGTGNSQSTVYERIPRCKIDIIVHNLMNKNCSIEYIDKFIAAMNCFNELFSLPSTINAETAPDEGVFLNYNSNSQMDKSTNETLKHDQLSRRQYKKASAAGPSNSYSMESIDSEEEPSSKHETYVCAETSARNLKSLAGRGDTRHLEHKEKQNAPTLSTGEALRKSNPNNQHEQRPIFETTDDDGETLVPDKPRNLSASNLSFAAQSSRRVRHQLVAAEKVIERVESCKSDVCYDSDVSIIGTCGTPTTNPGTNVDFFASQKRTENPNKRSREEEKQQSNWSYTTGDKNDHTQHNSVAANKSSNLSNMKMIGSSAAPAADKSTVQLPKIATTSVRTRSSSSFSKSEKTPKRRQNSVRNEDLGSDSENVSLRTSSRGRRILPPLHYWEGERLSLKGQELVYSPGTDRLGSVSANSSVLKNSSISNRTAVSEPGLSTTTARKLTGTPTGSREQAKYAGKCTSKSTEKSSGILMEISPNRNDNNHHAMRSDRESKRTPSNIVPEDMKGNKKTRTVREELDCSSDDEIPVVRQRKRRKVR